MVAKSLFSILRNESAVCSQRRGEMVRGGWGEKQSCVWFAPRTNAALFASACSCFLDPPEQTTKPTVCRAAEKSSILHLSSAVQTLFLQGRRELCDWRERKGNDTRVTFSSVEADTSLQKFGSLKSDTNSREKRKKEKKSRQAREESHWNCYDLIETSQNTLFLPNFSPAVVRLCSDGFIRLCSDGFTRPLNIISGGWAHPFHLQLLKCVGFTGLGLASSVQEGLGC